VTHEDLQWADAIAFGSPTRFGNITAQVKTYIDTLGGLWASNALVGKLASAFTSSNTQHGGQETTIVCGFLPLFLHLGMLVVGLPYTFAGTTLSPPHTTRHTPHTHNTHADGLTCARTGQFPVDEVSGGSPYGSSVVAGVWGARQPSENELNAGRFQGKHIATQAVRLGKQPAAVTN
jgi:NAD(P)H dehydrogenase (quinone)